MRRAALLALLLVALGTAAHAQTTPTDAKSLVTDFYRMVFTERQVKEAFERYVGPTYTQHNPRVPDGVQPAIDALTALVAQNPRRVSRIVRSVAEGDLVMLHVHVTNSNTDRGTAIAEIFRVENGRIVEHWDVIQPVPDTAANSNSMF